VIQRLSHDRTCTGPGSARCSELPARASVLSGVRRPEPPDSGG
jgi:hypothetical protein